MRRPRVEPCFICKLFTAAARLLNQQHFSAAQRGRFLVCGLPCREKYKIA